jgi:hypothetical protein
MQSFFKSIITGNAEMKALLDKLEQISQVDVNMLTRGNLIGIEDLPDYCRHWILKS